MITIVSGLPRSGTSLMMQMLTAGGMTAMSDGERKADFDNPKGYLEWEQVKQLPKNRDLIDQAEGRVVKVISQLILSLPAGHDYRVIFMQRPLPEVMASQDEMLRRRGNYDESVNHAAMNNAFRDHLFRVNTWLNQQANVKVLRVSYHDVLRDPKASAQQIGQFLGIPLNVDAMAAQVDESLYRQRGKNL